MFQFPFGRWIARQRMLEEEMVRLQHFRDNGGQEGDTFGHRKIQVQEQEQE